MASYRKTGNTFKGSLSEGQYFLPTCDQPTYVKIFNVAKPTSHDPCEGGGGGAPPPAESYYIMTFAGENMETMTAGDLLVQL